jgi:hypothetical protein
MASKDYRRLTRSRRRRGGLIVRSSLWLGNDHLLRIDSTSFAEEYRRFYFRDIQTITIRTTRRRLVWNLLLVPALAICITEITFGAVGFGAWEVFVLIVAVVLAALLLLNNILGVACRVHLKTAVGLEELSSLSRVRRALKVLERIRPMIAAAQGRLTPEEAVAGIRAANTPPGETEARTAAGSATGPLNLA